MRYCRNLARILLAACMIMACGCKRPSHTISRGFYFWRSVAGLNTAEIQTMQQQQVGRLYVKFFDVTWNPVTAAAQPAAKISFTENTVHFLQQQTVTLIPVVFITNETIYNTDSTQIASLAENIAHLLEAIVTEYRIVAQIPEIQIDCDWTASTRQKYFQLLQELKGQSVFQKRKLSATIRLYQCKYKVKTGVPPVDKGLLMCYNMGDLKDPASTNSILDPEELKKYIGELDKYPLPLDVAFPLFSWKVLFRDHAYVGLLQDLPDSLLQQPGIAARNNNIYTLLNDTSVNDYLFKKGDLVRAEDSKFEDIIRTAGYLHPKLVNDSFSVVLYHLDSLTLLKYSSHELEKIFSGLR